MLLRYLLLAVGGAMVLFMTYLALTNGQSVDLNAFNQTMPWSVSALICLAISSGGLLGFAIAFSKVGKVKAEKLKLEWDAQDAKLMASVKTDREKQLEAKITTLEAALKQALKGK